jgi:riboflavin synthase
MFTGIVKAMGVFRGFRPGKREFVIEAPDLSPAPEPGGSLAVDGVCLTLVRREKGLFVFDLSAETLGLTTLGALRPGAGLNLEPPLTLAAPIGGHIVNGHVDYRGKILRVVPRGAGLRLKVALPAAFRPFVVLKGSVAVNGVSLTIAAVSASGFEAELIPATLGSTNLSRLRPGAAVNVECDSIGKYVYNIVTRATR